MYRRLVFAFVGVVGAVGVSSARAELFDFGSDGSFGPINVANGATVTLNLPPDGIINATTVTVDGTLRFNRNALNTPVYLLATGNVIVRGSIDVSGNPGTSNPPVGGRGGPGGFDGGMPGFGAEVPPGAGHGPGAGLGGTNVNAPGGAGLAAYGTNPNANGDRPTNGHMYGSPSLIPLVGGSGGGGIAGQPGTGGMGGGGAILIASNTRIDIPSPGNVLANGGSGGCTVNEGSGGAIRLVSPVVAGNGTLQVGSGNCNYAGFGRIRIDSIDRTALQMGFYPNSSTTSVGSTMFAFPDLVPRLDIIEAAGQLIPEGTPGPVTVLLPFGSTSSRTVKVQARHFTGLVPIDVVLTPDNGDRAVYPAQINMGQGNVAQVVVNVEVPINSNTRVEVWTR